jgi:hypothetical protein
VPAFGERTLITMDAPPPQEDYRLYVRIAGMLAAAGVRAARVLAQDLAPNSCCCDPATRPTLPRSRGQRALYLGRSTRWCAGSARGRITAVRRCAAAARLDLFPW